MNTLRSMIFIIWLYGWMGLLGIIALPALLMPRAVILWFIRLYARLLLWGLRWICGVRVEIRGREHVSGGPALIAGKHQAMLDVFIPFLVYTDPVLVMKRELLWYPILGWYALKTEMLPIDRNGGARTMRKMLADARRKVGQQGRQLLIYPEGTRRRPGAKPDYKPAGIRGYYKALGLPITPIATNSGLCWPAQGLTRRPGRVVYQVLAPIDANLQPRAMLSRLEAELETASNALLQEGLAAQGRTQTALA